MDHFMNSKGFLSLKSRGYISQFINNSRKINWTYIAIKLHEILRTFLVRIVHQPGGFRSHQQEQGADIKPNFLLSKPQRNKFCVTFLHMSFKYLLLCVKFKFNMDNNFNFETSWNYFPEKQNHCLCLSSLLASFCQSYV